MLRFLRGHVVDYLRFRLVWCGLAELGACDGWGGAECMRVLKEWLAADCVPDLEAFIRARANVGPN